jgi:hypothetical protein
VTTSDDQPAASSPAEAVKPPVPVPAAAVKAPPPIPTGFPEAPAPADPTATAFSDTGTLLFPQPMKPAREGFVNLATVPPMGKLTVPPLEDGGETVIIDVYGIEVDKATAERAYAAAQTAGFSLREL